MPCPCAVRGATCLLALTLPSALQKTACTIPAHDGPLAALAFNSTGSKLASASEKVSERGCEHPPCCLCSLPAAGRGGPSQPGCPQRGEQDL